MKILIGLLIFVAVVLFFLWLEDGDCPRTIYGYKCKGKECDHSEGAVAEAKWNMKRK